MIDNCNKAGHDAADNLIKNLPRQEAESSFAAPSGSASGPSYCASCGEWPARMTPNGLRCHLCECRDYCAANPVPLPDNPLMLKDLASIGVPGAADKLQQTPTRGQQSEL